ncbi:hypothetical protein [Mycoplasmopsis gallopavonis]|uniref:Uncharacterized protein n=1 Tax=Mycoplasmopsis gallopavonis TaxID=76629 RepID=A0A449AZI2_9BACT|nr:hypothetical protein [Mycoplasmopsis gallopavonis]RIV16307.1 hypothetical protein D1113_02890 [Mycoplasmopsis gallopavonis]VEU72885.1 Uncharacterised protein [Mycoplasmopsis gallopavonis]
MKNNLYTNQIFKIHQIKQELSEDMLKNNLIHSNLCLPIFSINQDIFFVELDPDLQRNIENKAGIWIFNKKTQSKFYINFKNLFKINQEIFISNSKKLGNESENTLSNPKIQLEILEKIKQEIIDKNSFMKIIQIDSNLPL